jgi:hypothetical protein
MTDPVTAMTASAIVSLAFQEFVKSGAGDLAKRFTGEAITKIGKLRDLIWKKLKGNSDAEEALEKVQAGSEEEISDVATFLKLAMKSDQEFAGQVQAIAQEINAGKLLDQSSMTQNNYDNARGFQIKVEGSTANIGEVHISEKRSES